MDTLIVVLFVFIIFAIFVCLENSGYIKKKDASTTLIEGANNMDEYLQNARILSSQGICQDPRRNNEYIWPMDEETCTGITAFELNFVNPATKIASLPDGTSQELIDREVSLRYGDVVQIDGGGEDEYFIYRGNEINLQSYDGQIALFPYSLETGEEGTDLRQERLEYCYNQDGPVLGGISQETCTSEGEVFLRPIQSGNIIITELNENLKNEGCGDDGTTPAGLRCFTKDQIKISHCILPDPDSSDGSPYQIRPVDFWKTKYAQNQDAEGQMNQTVNLLCEGVPTGHRWIYNSDLNTMMDSQQFAEIQSQVDRNNVNAGYNEDYERFIETERELERILPLDLQNLERQQEQARTQYLQSDCNFENQDNPYHGNLVINNPSQSTANLYVCNDSSPLNLPATNVATNCESNQLFCDTNFARNDVNIFMKHIVCNTSNNTFLYRGCVPDICSLPANFDERYQIINNDVDPIAFNTGTGLTINHFKDMVDNTLNVRCADGYTAPQGISINSCSQDLNNGELAISGCVENTCEFPSQDLLIGYSIHDNTSPVTQNQFNETNNMNTGYSLNQENVLKCETPNYYHLSNVSDETFNEFMVDVNNSDKSLKNYTQYPSVVCNTPQQEGATSPFTFNITGCYENQCKNPLEYGVVYESISKPEHMADTKTIVLDSPDNKYDKYIYDNIINPNINITRNNLFDKIKCGKNFTLEGETSSTDDSNKIIPPENIKCYNFYDYYNLTNESNVDVPSYKKLSTDETISDHPEFADFSAWLNENSDIDRSLPFSINGCIENYCKWPTEDYRYDRPRIRTNIDNLDNYQTPGEDGKRYKLGYKYTADEPGSSNIDITSNQTAREFVGYNQNGDVSLQCIGTDGVCEVEPLYTNEEINTMLSNVPDEIKIKGQSTILNSDELSNVGRGGSFSVSRCWYPENVDESPNVSCQNQTDCTDPENSTRSCEANVSGCSQNLCTLSDEDALSGTRLLIEREGSEFVSIGGANRENMDSSDIIYFNVDQIRNITCDENFSKPIINPNDSTLPFGGGDLPEDITISCDSNNGTFTILNKCGPTQCDNQIDIIDGLVHLTDKNSDENSSCPNWSMIDSHTQSYDPIPSSESVH